MIIKPLDDGHIKYICTIIIINPHNDQLPVSLIAQLVENCAGIAEVGVHQKRHSNKKNDVN